MIAFEFSIYYLFTISISFVQNELDTKIYIVHFLFLKVSRPSCNVHFISFTRLSTSYRLRDSTGQHVN